MVVSCAQNDKLFFFMSTRNGTLNVFSRSILTRWESVALAGNGKDDVVVSNAAGGTITILFSK